MSEPREIVLTYRSTDRIEPVELTYARPLPAGMCLAEENDRAAETFASAIRPSEKKSSRWGVRLFVGLSLLIALVCLGVGIWYVQAYGWASPTEEAPPADTQLPGEPPYYWEGQLEEKEEPTIRRYRPFGGSIVSLSLVPVGEEAQPLTAGEVYEKMRASAVTVIGRQNGSYSVGTGVIFSENGYIVTNYHVIEGCSDCQVLVTDAYGADRGYEAMLVGGDADQDLAVLKVDAKGLPAAQFGVSDDLSVGDKVYAIGNPLGMELRGTFTDGIISAVDRDVYVDGVTMTLLQTNTALNSGNSGGPLINQYGQVVGINTIKMMSGYDTIEGLGFAIPTSLAQRWINEIIRFGEIQPQPLLGITINRIPALLPDDTIGLEVMEVTPGGSGDLAGIQVGDYVVAFAGQTVTSTEDVLALRRSLYVGDRVTIRVWRNDAYLELAMEMQKPE